MTAETTAATTEEPVTEPDGEEQQAPKSAESAPAVTDTDEVNREAKSGVSKRIDELTRNWREAERREQALLDLLKEQRATPEPKAQREELPEPPIKKLADFDYDESAYTKYVLGLAKDTAKREADSVREEIRTSNTEYDREMARQEFEEQVQTWAEKEKVEDFDIIFRQPRDGGPIISEAMAEAIHASDNAAALAYKLAKDRKLAMSIARLPPILQAREIGRLEASLAKPATSKVSEAPPPAPKIAGSSASQSVKADDPASDSLSDAEWTRMRNKQEAARRARQFR